MSRRFWINIFPRVELTNEQMLSIIDLIFPELCIACQKNKLIKKDCFCVACREKLSFTNQLEEPINSFTKRFYGRLPLHEAAALFWYSKGDTVQKMIYNIKYKQQKHIAFGLGKLLGEEILRTSSFKSIDYIIPIPIHPLKEHKRGYNQSALIAKSLSKQTQLKLALNCLYKKENTISQTHKSRVQRLLDITDSFGLKKHQHLKNKNILLLDDVLTTGATLEAAAILLLKAEVNSISMVTIAMGKM